MHFHAADEILDSLQDRFIKEMDGKAIAFSLESKGIITDGDRDNIRLADGAKEQNEVLFAVLKKKCTTETLKVVCDEIAAVQGNPKMKAFGQVLRRQL